MPRARVEALAAGDWIETGANLIAIGNAAPARPICSAPSATPSSKPVAASSTPAPPISCRFQAARRDLTLEAALARLDRFDLIILDDIGCAQKDQAESPSS